MKAILDWCQGAFFAMTLLAAMFGGFALYNYNMIEHVARGYVEIDSKLYKLIPAEAIAASVTPQAGPVAGGESCN